MPSKFSGWHYNGINLNNHLIQSNIRVCELVHLPPCPSLGPRLDARNLQSGDESVHDLVAFAT